MNAGFSTNTLLDYILILFLAVILDMVAGEPREEKQKIHPVVWMGKVISFFDKNVKRANPEKERLFGIICPVFIIALFSVPCLFLFLIKPYSEIVYIGVSALVLKSTFTIKTLGKYAKKTITHDIEKKKKNVSKIVSRNTANLDKEHLNSAAIESVAENLTDSVISPLFYFALLGIFGAMIYRVVNTLDAMVGYKNRKYAYFGWFSAKLDSFLNWIPERIAAGLICICGGNLRGAIVALKPRRREKVPRTIVAMSGVLGVKLEKLGHYSVGSKFGYPDEKHISRAITIMTLASIKFVAVTVVLMILLYGVGWRWLNPEILYLI